MSKIRPNKYVRISKNGILWYIKDGFNPLRTDICITENKSEYVQVFNDLMTGCAMSFLLTEKHPQRKFISWLKRLNIHNRLCKNHRYF